MNSVDPATNRADDRQREAAHAAIAETVEARERLLAAIEAGTTSLADVMERCTDDHLVGAVYVLPVMEADPIWGKVSSRRLLDGLEIVHTTPLGQLTGDQRQALVEASP